MGQRRRWIAIAIVALIFACSRSEGEPTAPAASVAPKLTAPDARKVLDRLIDEWLERFPSKGRELGLHRYDGQIGDHSARGIAERRKWLEGARDELTALDTQGDAEHELDRALCRREVELALFDLVEREQWRKNPLFYAELFAVNDYLDREYAPLETRVRALVRHEEAALRQIGHVQQNLVGPMSKPLLEVALKIFAGYAAYLRKDVVKLAAGVGDDALQKRFAAANEALAKAADRVAEHLRKKELPRADASHVLGEARFAKLLELQEGLKGPLSELERRAERNLAENKLAYERLEPTVKVTRPPVEELFSEAQSQVEAARRFVSERKLVTIPGEQKVSVKETPPYMRWNQAFLNAPGAFEAEGTEALYYITLPDPSWSKKEQREYVLPRGVLLATTVHEVYPGHFLQRRWLRRAPTRARKVFESYSFVEGWAHYVEQLMMEEGFLGATPELRLGQLSDALLRNCRVVASIAIHARSASLKDVARRFEQDCHQDQATAREQAVRGTFDPGYFAYTVGKLQILELRERARQKLGERFSLRRFHDALLSHGSPPVPWIEKRVLAELGSGILNP